MTPLRPMIPTIALLTQAASSLPSDTSALERSISALESCISALDSKAESLARSSARWDPVAWVFTSLVIIGVALELWVIWQEFRDDMKSWAVERWGIHRRAERPVVGNLVIEFLSVLLVVGGIIGELRVSVKIASINSELRKTDGILRSKNAELRSDSDQLLALVTQEAGDAAKSADKAVFDALLLGPRGDLLAGQRRKKLVDALKSFPGQKVDVQPIALIGSINGIPTGISPIADERDGLSRSLISVLNDAHWRAPETLSNTRSTLPGRGVSVHISASASQESRKAAKALVEALNKVPLVTTGPTFDGSDRDTILLVVHLKELPATVISNPSASH